MKNSLSATFFVKIYFNPKSWPSEISATPGVSENIEVSAEELQKKIDEIHENVQEKNAKIREIDEQISQTQQRITELERKIIVSTQTKKHETEGFGIMEMTQDEKDLIEAKDFLKTLESVKKSYVDQLGQLNMNIVEIEQQIEELDWENEVWQKNNIAAIRWSKWKVARVNAIQMSSKYDNQENLNIFNTVFYSKSRSTLQWLIVKDSSLQELIHDKDLLKWGEIKELNALIRKMQSNDWSDKENVSLLSDKVTQVFLFDVFDGLKKEWATYVDKGKIPNEKMELFKDFALTIIGAKVLKNDVVDLRVLNSVYKIEGTKILDGDRSKIKNIKGIAIQGMINKYSQYATKSKAIIDNQDLVNVIQEIQSKNIQFNTLQEIKDINLDTKSNAFLAGEELFQSLYSRYGDQMQSMNSLSGKRRDRKVDEFLNDIGIRNDLRGNKKEESPLILPFQWDKDLSKVFPNVSIVINWRIINAAAPRSRESFMQAFNKGEYISLTNVIPLNYMSNLPKDKQNKEPLLMQKTLRWVFTEYVGNRFPITSSRDGPKATMLHLELTRHPFTEKLFRSPYNESLNYFEKNFARKFPDRRPEDESWRFQESIFQEMARVSGISEFNVSGQANVERLLFKINDPDFYKPLERRMRETGMMDESGKITEATMRKSENFTKMNTWQKSQDSTEKWNQSREKNQYSTKDTPNTKSTNVDNMSANINDNIKTTQSPNSDPLSFLA